MSAVRIDYAKICELAVKLLQDAAEDGELQVRYWYQPLDTDPAVPVATYMGMAYSDLHGDAGGQSEHSATIEMQIDVELSAEGVQAAPVRLEQAASRVCAAMTRTHDSDPTGHHLALHGARITPSQRADDNTSIAMLTVIISGVATREFGDELTAVGEGGDP